MKSTASCRDIKLVCSDMVKVWERLWFVMALASSAFGEKGISLNRSLSWELCLQGSFGYLLALYPGL